MSYVISGTEKGAVSFPVADFEASVRAHWNGSVQSVGRANDGMVVADLQPTDQPGFSVRLARDGEAMSTDGTPAQVADVAVWAVSLLPVDEGQTLLLYDANGQRVLEHGMSPEDVWSGWEDY